eukprot:TRINITY_DN1720_c0_g1_i3.p1 TRINITY_DN1720_c0_g1~~TRINITY_DN1720_c0_g1_i3.p1  ORF type:complete len:125 (-),score=39.95 TRINITY_DN1720_c0_g1_i3:171-545(-)
MIDIVKVWIHLNVPRIEDGNNFGVSIQEETINELGRTEDAGLSILENITKYFLTRGKLITKVAKHPHLEDYKQAVIELDSREFVNLRMCILELRNNYSILWDGINKNLEKLRTPRSTHHLPSIM